MSRLTAEEAQLLSEVSAERVWAHAEALARWEKVSGTPGELAAVDYIQAQLEACGLKTTRYEFESLLGWPESAGAEIRSPERRPMRAITHGLVPSTPEEGLEAEAVYLGAGREADFRGSEVAGKLVITEGMPSPLKVLLAQEHGAAGLIGIQEEHIHELCVSPVWGTPTTKTARNLARIPVISIGRADGEYLKGLLKAGPVRVWVRARTFWGWRKTPIVVGELAGSVEPEKFVLFSGHHCSWYFGAMDNGAANATMLEVGRVLGAHRGHLRRSVRIAFWPGHTQGRYSGSTWYADNFWEEIYDHCVLHVNADSTGARGAEIYHALCMPETREFALGVIRDAIGREAYAERMPRAGDQSFWGHGVPSIFMSLSLVPPELAAERGQSQLFTAAGEAGPVRGGLPWFWHTAEDTIDKLDPEVLVRDTKVYLLAVWRAAVEPVLPLRYGETARELKETVEAYQAAAGGAFDLGPVVDRVRRLEGLVAEVDRLAERVRVEGTSEEAVRAVNAGLVGLGRALVPVYFTAAGPFDHDLAVPVPPVPLLEPVRRLRELRPDSDEARFLKTELVRNRNKVMFFLRQAIETAGRTIAAVREVSGDQAD